MDIILLERIQNLGDIGDEVKVKRGYARNYLIPTHKAMIATPEARAAVEARRQEFEKGAGQRLQAAKDRVASAATEITFTRRISDEGKMFGSVTATDIADAMSISGVEIAKSEVQLPEGPIKQIGDHDIEVVVHPEVKITVQVSIAAERGDTAPE